MAVRRCFISIVLCALLLSSAEGVVVWVENVSLGVPGIVYYANDTVSINKDAGAFIGNLDAAGGTTYEYSITDFNITLEACSLESDDSSGGVASGNFYGGAKLTITGDLTNTEDNPDTIYVSDGVILEATMTLSSTETWNLHEEYDGIYGQAFFSPTAGALFDGITLAGGDVLKMSDFRADFNFLGFPISNPVDFDNHTGTLMTSAGGLQLVAVPEPCTVLLLAFGGIGLLRNRNK